MRTDRAMQAGEALWLIAVAWRMRNEWERERGWVTWDVGETVEGRVSETARETLGETREETAEGTEADLVKAVDLVMVI